MGIFNLFKRKKKYELTNEQLQWNKLWELWSNNELEKSVYELMNYDSEIQNGGHLQFFLNVRENGDLDKVVKELYVLLPDVLKHNLKDAYDIFLSKNIEVDTAEEYEDVAIEEYFSKNDNIYYQNYELVENILKEHASKLVIQK